ncbi:hypothetical protein J8273_0809 [Carpediemonas membranifera]|uniref:Transmembrane protein n=1 Tax=Carpediemonas membranifera TaxID=201153 RepID=A0A8J6BC23_9EUKA|nr:hypothetical protein J8273_0809 [Carpediemonas membranifera]|eukprot:KAG9397679.1 hypothetical protein J8273_0809 [Carpediemonas membranifera]
MFGSQFISRKQLAQADSSTGRRSSGLSIGRRFARCDISRSGSKIHAHHQPKSSQHMQRERTTHVLNERPFSEADIVENMTVTLDDFKLALDVFMANPMHYVGVVIAIVAFAIIYGVYATVISLAYSLVITVGSMVWTAALGVCTVFNNAVLISLALLAVTVIGLVLLLLSIVILLFALLLPLPPLIYMESGIRQGIIKEMLGRKISIREALFPDKEFIPRITIIYIVVIVVVTPISMLGVTVPLIYAAQLLTFSTVSFLLLTRKDMGIVACIKLGVKANTRNIFPLLIFWLMTLAVHMLDNMTGGLSMFFTYGFCMILEIIFAGKMFQLIRPEVMPIQNFPAYGIPGQMPYQGQPMPAQYQPQQYPPQMQQMPYAPQMQFVQPPANSAM